MANRTVVIHSDYIDGDTSGPFCEATSLDSVAFPGGVAFKAEFKTSDYTLLISDHIIGVNTASGDITVTVPDATNLTKNHHWEIYKVSDDINKVIVELEVSSQSLSTYSALPLYYKGSGVRIKTNAANNLFWYNSVGGAAKIIPPAVTTKRPTISDTTLSAYCHLEDLGNNAAVNWYFRYRIKDSAAAWTTTTPAAQASTAALFDTITVASGSEWETQAVAEDVAGDTYPGVILTTEINYYRSLTEAIADNLDYYWDLQESIGTDTVGDEKVVGAVEDTTFYNGVTIDSDTINGATIYKRIFGASDYGQAATTVGFDLHSHTILVQSKHLSSSSDHTILNFGRNRVSLASTGTSIQLEVNNLTQDWTSASPFASNTNLFIVVDTVLSRCSLYTCDTSTRTLRATVEAIPDKEGQYIRLGRGAAGDANHQDSEYMANNSEIRSLAIWSRVLTEVEMKQICVALDTDGGLLV